MSTRFSGSLDDAINNFKDVVSSLDFSTYGKIRGFSSFGFGLLNRHIMLIYIYMCGNALFRMYVSPYENGEQQ